MNAVSLHHIEQRLLADSSSLGKELVLRISPDRGGSEVINIAAHMGHEDNFARKNKLLRLYGPDLHIQNPHIKSDNLAKTESLLISDEQKLSSGLMW